MRSSHDKMLAGVLGGFAERYNVSSTLLRVLFVASFLLPGPQFLVYIAAWIIMPKRY
ncbi:MULTISPECIES: PspC domain-containing protein [unclassified Corynebacterium]|uniref:PspC domain-containing protein n=1 Tax=Corynebacterium sp. H78 TaxID=3133417 RepID=UPI0030A14D5D